MTGGPYDPRAVANLMLDEADRSGSRSPISPFKSSSTSPHSIFLIEAKRPLVSGYFEAWQYGPVHPTAYAAFKTGGSSPIDFRADRAERDDRRADALDLPEDLAIRRHLARIMSSYGQLSPGRLVDISHAKGAPWDYIADKGRTSVALGLQIPDDVIVNQFKFHKVSVGAAPVAGEPDKIRRLPEIDLARVATLPTDQKRLELERFKLGHPTITYKPVRTRFADIFNVQPDMFGDGHPIQWSVLRRTNTAKVEARR